IVKGGQQDRSVVASLVLQPKSGRVSIAAFCVEQGRWSARGREDVKHFSSSAAAVPSREMKLAMKAPKPAPSADPAVGPRGPGAVYAETGARQSMVWDAVRKVQSKLTGNLGAPVNSAQSASSLQLALENEKLIDAQKAYVNALKAAGEADDDIVGYV